MSNSNTESEEGRSRDLDPDASPTSDGAIPLLELATHCSHLLDQIHPIARTVRDADKDAQRLYELIRRGIAALRRESLKKAVELGDIQPQLVEYTTLSLFAILRSLHYDVRYVEKASYKDTPPERIPALRTVLRAICPKLPRTIFQPRRSYTFSSWALHDELSRLLNRIADDALRDSDARGAQVKCPV